MRSEKADNYLGYQRIDNSQWVKEIPNLEQVSRYLIFSFGYVKKKNCKDICAVKSQPLEWQIWIDS